MALCILALIFISLPLLKNTMSMGRSTGINTGILKKILKGHLFGYKNSHRVGKIHSNSSILQKYNNFGGTIR